MIWSHLHSCQGIRKLLLFHQPRQNIRVKSKNQINTSLAASAVRDDSIFDCLSGDKRFCNMIFYLGYASSGRISINSFKTGGLYQSLSDVVTEQFCSKTTPKYLHHLWIKIHSRLQRSKQRISRKWRVNCDFPPTSPPHWASHTTCFPGYFTGVIGQFWMGSTEHIF